MKIFIIGVGGVGGYFGGLLARAGEDVTFVARGEHFAVLKKDGLSVKSVTGDFRLPAVQVVEDVAEIESPDLVIIATKTYDRDEIACQLARVLDDATIVIPVQNGIENDLKIKALVSDAKVYPGLAYIISKRSAPGVIEQTAGPRSLFFGERGRAASDKLKQIESIMRNAGIEATASDDIEKELWTKFLWITTFAGMTAVCRSSIGPIVNDPQAFNLYIRCLDEGMALADSLGIELGDEIRTRLIEKSEHYKHTGVHARCLYWWI